MFYIWSNEHNAWWRPGRMGYTTNKQNAGIYNSEEAEKILEQANVMCNEDNLNEIKIPVSE